MDLESDGELPPTWDILINTEVVHVPHLLCGTLLGYGPYVGVVDSELCYLSCSDGVSYKMWSQMCGSWYLASSY